MTDELNDDEYSEEDENEGSSIQVDMDESIAQGVYSNLVISNFSQEEFCIDFVFLQPQMPKGKTRSRVIITPKNAKRLANLLKKNVMDYEKKFGPITDDPSAPGIRMSIN